MMIRDRLVIMNMLVITSLYVVRKEEGEEKEKVGTNWMMSCIYRYHPKNREIWDSDVLDDEEVDGMMFCIGIGGRGAGCIWVDWDALCCQLVLSCTAMHTLHTLQLSALRCKLCYRLHLLLQVAL